MKSQVDISVQGLFSLFVITKSNHSWKLPFFTREQMCFVIAIDAIEKSFQMSRGQNIGIEVDATIFLESERPESSVEIAVTTRGDGDSSVVITINGLAQRVDANQDNVLLSYAL